MFDLSDDGARSDVAPSARRMGTALGGVREVTTRSLESTLRHANGWWLFPELGGVMFPCCRKQPVGGNGPGVSDRVLRHGQSSTCNVCFTDLRWVCFDGWGLMTEQQYQDAMKAQR